MGAVRGSWRERGFEVMVAASLLALACGRTAKGEGDDGATPGKDPPAKPVAQAANCAIAIDGREGRHCAVYQDGSVWCWGFDWPAQPSNFTPTSAPTQVKGIENATRVIVGPRHSCASLVNSAVVCWGDNESGQIDDSGTASLPPTLLQIGWDQVAPLKGFALGDKQTCALNFLSHAACRGVDLSGAVVGSQAVAFPGPPETTMPGPYPYLIDGLGRIFELMDWANPSALPQYGDDNAWFMRGIPNCLLKRSGSLWCDSENAGAPNDTMFAVANLGERVTQAAIGKEFWCALSDGKVWCQGSNFGGQTATGDQEDGAPGHFVAGLEDVQSVSLNNYSGCALKGDGSVWCWGRNTTGPVRTVPEQVSGCVNQTIPPFASPSPPGRSSATARLGQASLARAQAMCVCAVGRQDAEHSCIEGENHAPSAPCLVALTPDDSARHNCLANLDWQDAQCFAQQPCQGEDCPFGADCPPPKHPQAEQFCRRRGCASEPSRILPIGAFCDSVRDCLDGSDEYNCRDDLGGSFECNPESRIQLNQLCDGSSDCDNGSDELFCP
jgi:Regulator of chromosome condensation (RCC1) repeat/Low-density lipoprotein receptor domain class A